MVSNIMITCTINKLTRRNEFSDFSLTNNSVTDVEPPVLPLDWTIDLDCIA